jgi:UDP-N-acetyl-D-glucosamine dehydrogenase
MLKQKILDRTTRFGVLGLGYVGLPLAVEFAKAGMRVTGFEVDTRKVEKLAVGESYIGDVPSSEVAPLVKRGLFSATTDFDELAQMDVVSICVLTLPEDP